MAGLFLGQPVSLGRFKSLLKKKQLLKSKSKSKCLLKKKQLLKSKSKSFLNAATSRAITAPVAELPLRDTCH
jgi:hypothetical protein